MFSWLKNLFRRKKITIDSLVAGCNGNLASLSFDIGKAVVYVKDKKFMTAQEALDAGVGDCDEFAKIWLACLTKLGYKPHMYYCFNKSEAHAIVVFLRKGFYCYTSNDDYFKTNITDLDTLLKFAYKADRYEIVV